MRAPLPLVLLPAIAAASSAWYGCSRADDDGEAGGQAVSAGGTAFSACTVVSMKDGHTMTADELGKLGDPIANLVLKGQDCPLTLTQIQAKLAKNDPCAAAEPGLTSRFVTDRAQLLERPDTYRAVLTRACQKRQDHELLVSVFGIATQTDSAGNVTATSVPDNAVELIGERKGATSTGVVTGVFNYYAREDNQWRFFGSSTDFLSQGYDCNADGACVPKAASKQRCAACHVGGGLNMKELESPWTSWEGGNDFTKAQTTFGTPGVAQIIAKRPEIFGAHSDGVAMEQTVESGNALWVTERVAFLKTLGLKEVLRPLFCTTDMNLAASGGFLSVDLFVDRIWNRFLQTGAHATTDELTAAITANGQHIVDGQSGQPLLGAGGKPLLDTVQGTIFPVRSGQDNAYILELQAQRVVDIDLVKDVLDVDLTRPIYSPTRCQLLDALDFAPDLSPDQMTFAAVKKKLVDALASAKTSGAALEKLKTNLQDPTDAAKHDLEASNFLKACDARSQSDRAGYIADYFAYASHLRAAVKRAKNPVNGGIIEFAETLPADDLVETHAAFDPTTCKLK